jgi:hypothetical protein
LRGTCWEQRKKEKNPPLPPKPKTWKKIKQGTWRACWAFPLAAWNFCFQNCLSPFLAWDNTPIIKEGGGVLIYRWRITTWWRGPISSLKCIGLCTCKRQWGLSSYSPFFLCLWVGIEK